jgi:hypothetical protein
MARPPLLLVLLVVGAASAYGAVYKWTDADGVVHYGDQPVDGAKRVELPEPSRYAPPPLPRLRGEEPAGRTDAADSEASYERFAITRPEAGEYVRNASGDVEVELALEPGLQEGHRIQLLVDGVPARQDLTSTRALLKNVARGTHSIQARVMDASGEILIAAGPVPFFLFVETVEEPGEPGEAPPSDGPAYPPIPRDETQFSRPPQGNGEEPYAPEPRPEDAFSPSAPGGSGSVYQPSYQPSFQPRD